MIFFSSRALLRRPACKIHNVSFDSSSFSDLRKNGFLCYFNSINFFDLYGAGVGMTTGRKVYLLFHLQMDCSSSAASSWNALVVSRRVRLPMYVAHYKRICCSTVGRKMAIQTIGGDKRGRTAQVFTQANISPKQNVSNNAQAK